MKYRKVYSSILIIMGVTIIFVSKWDSFTATWNYIGFLVLLAILSFIFYWIDSSRGKRALKWQNNHPTKFLHSIKFSLLLGLPTAAVLYYIIHEKTQISHFVLFILIPMLVLFTWVGYHDYKNCESMFLKNKYNL